MSTRRAFVVGLAVALGLLAGLATPRLSHWWTKPQPGHCPICQRHEHAESAVEFQAQGEGVTRACCLSCALSYGRQAAKPVTIVRLTDHETGKPLAPGDATLLVGSDVSPCIHDAGPPRLAEGAVPVQWDRCLPSVLAFASGEAAETFRRHHGGRIGSLQAIVGEASGAAPASR